MNLEMSGRDIYLRHTNPDGTTYVKDHRVWDADKFIAAQQIAAANVNEQEKDPAKRKAKVEQITDDQYRKEKRK